MDKQPYPVVTQRFLDVVPAKRFFARGPHGRSANEIPRLLAGHRLVYFTRGEYVLDTTALSLDSPTVVDASQVTVVDVTADTEMVVLLTIPSQDAGSFTVRVTFLCTVDDPVAVVRAGGHDAESVLSGYLKAHHRLFELGLDYALADINEMRRKVSAQVRAYVTMLPPEFDGMSAKLASVEVLTPEELAKFQESLRDQRLKYTVDSEKQRHEQQLEDQQHQFKRFREADDQQHDRDMAARQREYEREQLQHTVAVVADDPIAALGLSYAAGDISAKELAGELKELRRQEVIADREDMRARVEFDREREKARWEAERLDEDRRLSWHREDMEHRRTVELRRAEWDREDRRLDREEAKARWEAERLDENQQLSWVREDRRLELEQERREFEAKVEVIRELAKHGHLDNLNLRLDQVVNDVLGGRATTRVEEAKGDERPALESRSGDDEPQADDLDGDEKVKVDD